MSGLTGKTIVVTRAAQKADHLTRLIKQRGGNPLLFPMIEIRAPDSWDECDRSLRALDSYDAFLFTSVNGVEYFFKRIDELRITKNNLRSKPTYAVGPKTGAAAEEHRLAVVAVPQQFTALDLARTLTEKAVQGKKFLFPRGDKGRDVLVDELRQRGAFVDVITVYRTEYTKQHDTERVRSQIMNGTIDVITFTSPSAVINFTSLFSLQDREQFRRLYKIAVIGPVTNEALASVHMWADITAAESTIESLVNAIEGFYST